MSSDEFDFDPRASSGRGTDSGAFAAGAQGGDLRSAYGELERLVRERTADLEAANRTLRMVSQCNEALLRATCECELVQEVCRTIEVAGGFKMVWVGYAERDRAKTVRPVASAGVEEGYLEQARISWANEKRGRGPTGSCIRTKSIRVCNDFLTDPKLAPWREEAKRVGFRSSIALPLVSESRILGALTIYSSEACAFGRETAALLRELANNLGFGITALRARAERDLARGLAEQQAAQLRSLAVELGEVEQRERRRLAKILHDHVQQLLVGARFNLGSLRGKLSPAARDRVVQQVAAALDGASDVARSLAVELSPPVLESQGLDAALEWLGRHLGERLGLKIEVHVDPRAEPEVEQVRVLLFEAVRELLLNLSRLSAASPTGPKGVEIRMARRGKSHVQVTVAGDGPGFGAHAVAHSGLASIRERLQHLGGSLSIDAEQLILVGPLHGPRSALGARAASADSRCPASRSRRS